jgi:hypothetical protein
MRTDHVTEHQLIEFMGVTSSKLGAESETEPVFAACDKAIVLPKPKRDELSHLILNVMQQRIHEWRKQRPVENVRRSNAAIVDCLAASRPEVNTGRVFIYQLRPLVSSPSFRKRLDSPRRRAPRHPVCARSQNLRSRAGRLGKRASYSPAGHAPDTDRGVPGSRRGEVLQYLSLFCATSGTVKIIFSRRSPSL